MLMSHTPQYEKHNNSKLFESLKQPHALDLYDIQNYIPIYARFFKIHNRNFSNLNLTHDWRLDSVHETVCDDNVANNGVQHIIKCGVKHTDTNVVKNTDVFFKIAPLLDPYKYLSGKYQQYCMTQLPSPMSHHLSQCHKKIFDTNNSSYIDGLFSFLASRLYYRGFIHAIPYYGSFLAVKNNFKTNIIDDLEYLITHKFFIQQQDKLFDVEDYSHLCVSDYNVSRRPLHIEDTCVHSGAQFTPDTVPTIYDDIFEPQSSVACDINTTPVSPETYDMQPVTHDFSNNTECDTCVSLILRDTSATNTPDYTLNMDTLRANNSDGSESSRHDSNNLRGSSFDDTTNTFDSDETMSDDCTDIELESNETMSDECSTTYSEIDEDAQIVATIAKFPVQIICMEKCDATLYSLIRSNVLTDDEWLSAFMQIIMTLLTYNEVYSLIHNDLHANNVMYVTTSLKYLYYMYNNVCYKVPTFGRIFKIIDYGRATYQFQTELYCSDSYQSGGDAANMYNTEPFFDPKKTRINPNPSFDLCRLGCSLIDYIFDSIDDIKNTNAHTPTQRIINNWCTDDAGSNVMYDLNTNKERYAQFKLYKMIARTVHGHSPQSQLERAEFMPYQIHNTEYTASMGDIDAHHMSIDSYLK